MQVGARVLLAAPSSCHEPDGARWTPDGPALGSRCSGSLARLRQRKPTKHEARLLHGYHPESRALRQEGPRRGVVLRLL